MAVNTHENTASPTSLGRPVRAVLFDFHGTLAQLEPLADAVRCAGTAAGVSLTPDRISRLAKAFVDIGWVGAGTPFQVPHDLTEAWDRRDLTEVDHRRAFVGVAAQVEASSADAFDGLADQMYTRMVSVDGWVAYADARPTLAALRRAGVPTALISNIGFDARPILDRLSLMDLLDEILLSFEIGSIKPDPAIFLEACRRLDVRPEDALMVGDTEADGAARAVGIRTLLLPFAGPGDVVGLDPVRTLALDR